MRKGEELKATRIVIDLNIKGKNLEESKLIIKQYCLAVNKIADMIREQLTYILAMPDLEIIGDSLNKSIVKSYVLNTNAEDIIGALKLIEKKRDAE